MKPLIRTLAFLGRYRVAVVWVGLSLIATSLLGLARPWMIQQVIDKALEYGSLSVVGLYAVGVVAVALLGAAAELWPALWHGLYRGRRRVRPAQHPL